MSTTWRWKYECETYSTVEIFWCGNLVGNTVMPDWESPTRMDTVPSLLSAMLSFQYKFFYNYAIL